MAIEPDLLRSLTGEYQEVVKSASESQPSRVVATHQNGDPVEKAIVISVTGTEVVSAGNNRPSVESEANWFLGAGALIPRYDPWATVRTWENSSALRPCVDAYAANVDGYGFTLVPVIDLDKSDASDLVRDALLMQRIYDHSIDPVDDDHVAATIETMRAEMKREKFALERFFAYCNPTTSFVEMRMQTRLELETTGNAYWEVIRNGNRQIQQFERIDAVTMRLRPIHIEHVLVDTPQKMSPLKYTTVPVPRRFRTFVQLVNGLIAVYFKEFGDTRILSAKTGNFYASPEELKDKEGELAVEATEILWWSVFSPIGPYGIPRWVGATMNVLGLRASEEINFSYFDQKCIPPMAILVSGGSLKAGAVDLIKNHLKETIQGRANFHSVLLIEAESNPAQAMSSASRVKVELRPLTEAQLKDALFQEYEKNGTSKIGSQFRLPELLRGVSQEVNRAQAQAVLQFAEQQVFEPLREQFDHVMNRRVLADMGIRYWTFKTNSAPASDPTQLVTLVTQLATAGSLTTNEVRAAAGEALNKEYKKLDAPWADAPYTLVLQGIMGLDGGAATPPAGGAPGAPGEPGGDGSSPPGGPPPGASKPGDDQEPKTAPAGAPLPDPGGAGGAAAEPGGDDALAAYFKRHNITKVQVPVAKLLEWVTPSGE